jgi:hypothetical protein
MDDEGIGAYNLWDELDDALNECKEELPEVPPHLLEIHHLLHFFVGLHVSFLKNLLEDAYIRWKEFEELFLKSFYTTQ